MTTVTVVEREEKEEVMYCRWAPTYEPGMRPNVSPILVWRFHQAPEEIKDLANQGGDEDWIALVPPDMAEAWLPWAETGSPFGVCEVAEIKLADGGKILVGTHS